MTLVKPKLLVSACLLGQPVRYDGQSKPIAELDWLQQLQTQGLVVQACPEMMGGLGVPRSPAERVNDQIITVAGDDVTEAFQLGAERTLTLCKKHQVTHALLKANSPSCGNAEVYDGSFSRTLVPGMGVTAALLQQHGIAVFSEQQFDELKAALATTANGNIVRPVRR